MTRPAILEEPPGTSESLDAAVPAKHLDRNLLIAPWNLRALGEPTERGETGDDYSPKRNVADAHVIARLSATCPCRSASQRLMWTDGIRRREIADLLGVSARTVGGYLEAQPCTDRGAPVVKSGSGRCRACATATRPQAPWTKKAVLGALGRWKDETGKQPKPTDWGDRLAFGERWHREYRPGHPATDRSSVSRFLARDAQVARARAAGAGVDARGDP